MKDPSKGKKTGASKEKEMSGISQTEPHLKLSKETERLEPRKRAIQSPKTNEYRSWSSTRA